MWNPSIYVETVNKDRGRKGCAENKGVGAGERFALRLLWAELSMCMCLEEMVRHKNIAFRGVSIKEREHWSSNTKENADLLVRQRQVRAAEQEDAAQHKLFE